MRIGNEKLISLTHDAGVKVNELMEGGERTLSEDQDYRWRV